jgi:hypothetical protein
LFAFSFYHAPKVKDPAWIHADLVDEEMFRKYCKKHIKRGGHSKDETSLGWYKRPSCPMQGTIRGDSTDYIGIVKSVSEI